jgi:hypothetical protein
MSKLSELEKRTRAVKIKAGITDHLAIDKIALGGKRFTRAQLLAVFEDHLAALDAAASAYVVWRRAVSAERKADAKARAVEVLLKRLVLAREGASPVALGAYGWTPAKAPGPRTVASKAAGVKKRAALRAAKKAALAKVKKVAGQARLTPPPAARSPRRPRAASPGPSLR